MSGIYHADSIRDVAEALGINNLPEGVASMLASDVEYRLHQIIEEASRFTRHSKRTTLTTTDIDQAFRVLNIEPVYGHSALTAPAFKRATFGLTQPVYALQDEEIDFDKIVREEEIPVPRAVSWTAHWLAIEGVQPMVPENPSPATTTPALAKARPSQPQANGTSQQHAAPPSAVPKPHLTTKSQLSRELQQYYARLTDALLPGNVLESGMDRQVERKRTAALSSLRNDAGLQGILPYLVKWVGDSVVGALSIKSLAGGEDEMGDLEDDVDRRVLDIMLSVINAILDNKRLFVEPYLHMILPPLLSILLTSTLSSSSSYSSLPSQPPPTPKTLRKHAASLVAHLLELHAPSYPTLPPRITKTLLVALLDDGSALPAGSSPSGNGVGADSRRPLSLGTKDGAIRGLMGVGQEAVYRGLIEGKAGKLLGDEIERRIGSRGLGDGDATMADLSGLGAGSEDSWTEEIKDVVGAFMVAAEGDGGLGRSFQALDFNKPLDAEDTLANLDPGISEGMTGLESFGEQREMGLAMGLGGDVGSLDANAMDAT
ncbi:hypothetical protein FRB99_007073 [Tulasnella sp. 403]|nr:hypothetical protein FRB99_007073 [Tulasnella sp. 403]